MNFYKRVMEIPKFDLLIWVVAIIGVLIFQGLPGPRILDDAFITFRYARNIFSGIGFVYNPGELVQGTTTPLYTLILVLFSFVFGTERIPDISFGIALVADVLNTWLLYRIGKFILKQDLVAFLLAIVFLLQPLRINVAKSGMETSFFISMMLAMYDRYFIGKRALSAFIFGSLLILTRPDAVLAVGPVFLHAWWEDRLTALKAILVAILILGPWYIWATWYFGNPIPFSIYAKMATYQNYSPLESLTFLMTFLGTGTIGPYKNLIVILPGLIIALFLVILGLRWLWKNNKLGLIIVSYPILYYFIMTIRHVPVFFSWYYPPLIPGLLILFFSAFLELFSIPLWKPTKMVIPLFVFVAMLISIPITLIHFFPGWADTREIESYYDQASSSIRDQATNKLIFSPDIGMIGWNLKNSRILDPIGLVSPMSLKYIDKHINTSEAFMYMIQDNKPDFVFARDNFLKSIIRDPDFIYNYQIIWQNKSQVNEVKVYKRK